MHGNPALTCGAAASDFRFTGLNLAIRGQGCYLTEVIGRQEHFSLLSGSILLAACVLASCAAGEAPTPDLPQSISPGWTRTSFTRAPVPASIPRAGAPQCWKADYAGQGSTEVWVCGYKVSANAFDAMQRARAEAQTVKFQEDKYLVLVKWNDVPKANLTALVRAIQKAVQGK